MIFAIDHTTKLVAIISQLAVIVFAIVVFGFVFAEDWWKRRRRRKLLGLP